MKNRKIILLGLGITFGFTSLVPMKHINCEDCEKNNSCYNDMEKQFCNEMEELLNGRKTIKNIEKIIKEHEKDLYKYKNLLSIFYRYLSYLKKIESKQYNTTKFLNIFNALEDQTLKVMTLYILYKNSYDKEHYDKALVKTGKKDSADFGLDLAEWKEAYNIKMKDVFNMSQIFKTLSFFNNESSGLSLINITKKDADINDVNTYLQPLLNLVWFLYPSLEVFYLSGENITEIKGLDKFSNLRSLDIRNIPNITKIERLNALENLKKLVLPEKFKDEKISLLENFKGKVLYK